MTDEELAAQAEAEAAALAEQEAAEAEAAAEAAAQTPQGMTPEQVAQIVAQATANARAEWEAESTRTVQSDPADEFAEHFNEYGEIKDVAKYTKAVMESATRRAVAEVDAKYAGRLKPIEAEGITNRIANGLGAKGREYVAGLAHMIDPADVNDKTVEILRRAARDYEREHTVSRERVPRTHEDTPVVVKSEDRQVADMLAQIAASATGQEFDRLRLKDEQIGGVSMGDQL